MFFESAATPRSEKAAKDILGVSGDLTSNIGDVERGMSDLKMKYTVANKEMDNKEQTIRATKKMLDDEYKAAAVNPLMLRLARLLFFFRQRTPG